MAFSKAEPRYYGPELDSTDLPHMDLQKSLVGEALTACLRVATV